MMCASFGAHAAVEQRRHAVDVDPVGLELDHVDLGAALAQRQQRAVVGRALDDDGVAGATSSSNRNASACIEPLVTSTCAGSTPWRSAIHARSGT